jgi:SET domain-containing protein
MKAKLFQNKLILQKSKAHGYGVFAGKNMKKGELLEECYFILTKGGDKTLDDFYFEAKGKGQYKYALFTGFGIVYNHSDEPNGDYFINIKNRVTTFKAKKDIKKGEEIFISYGDEWFSSRHKKFKKIKG